MGQPRRTKRQQQFEPWLKFPGWAKLNRYAQDFVMDGVIACHAQLRKQKL